MGWNAVRMGTGAFCDAESVLCPHHCAGYKDPRCNSLNCTLSIHSHYMWLRGENKMKTRGKRHTE